MIFTYTTVVYATLFLVLGVILLVITIPRKTNLAAYRTSRRVFACAYLLLGVTGFIDFLFFPADSERNYITIYDIGVVSLIHAWLNTYAYLLLQEPSRKNLRRFRRYGSLGLPLIIVVGGMMVFIPSAYPFASFAMGAIYAGQIGWTISICFSEYRANARAMENYYDGTLRFSWMNGALKITLGLALLNLLAFYIISLSLPLRIATTVFYLYFAIRLLNYVHVFGYVGEARKEDATRAKIECIPIGKSNHPAAMSGYSEKLSSAIDLWCKEKRFCNYWLTIKMVAYEMDSNHTYLSAYINKQLGCSFQQWLNNLRIEESKVLLRKYPNRTIEEIGRMVGISQPYNFSRWFKQITGLSPQQWKKQVDSD